MKLYCWLLLCFCLLLAACRNHSTPSCNKAISFYYWKTQFSLNETEKNALQQHGVNKLYVRYFDVDQQPEAAAPAPVSPIRLDSSIRNYAVVPVVFLKNRVFEKLDSIGVITLAQQVFALITQINQSQQITTSETQFDCDWAPGTRNNFFRFIQHYRALSKQTISATIRLHQVKYKTTTGVPPVDRGVLMYYNMGSINTGQQNSIYDQSLADKYTPYLAHYPLPLDVALPIFSWGYTIRDNKVVELLNKLNESYFKNDSNFLRISPTKYAVKHPGLKAGYYFKENDVVKLEQVTTPDLLHIAAAVHRYSMRPVGSLIFYDLDSVNLVRYEEDFYERVCERFE